jgi:hypothetical protein
MNKNYLHLHPQIDNNQSANDIFLVIEAIPEWHYILFFLKISIYKFIQTMPGWRYLINFL